MRARGGAPLRRRLRRACCPVVGGIGAAAIGEVGAVAEQAAGRQQGDDDARGSGDAERRGGTHPGAGGPRPDERGDDPADGERGVEGRHDGPVVGLLHVHGVGVHAHVQAAVAEAEHQQRARQRPGIAGKAGQHEGGAAQHAGGGDHDARAEPVGQSAGDLHADEGAEAQQHQQASQRRVADSHAFLDGGDLHQPHAHQGAVEDEVDEGRHPGGSE